MKLRIRGDSIRLRLSQAEVAQIGAGKAVQESTKFLNGSRFDYVMEPSTEAKKIEALMIENKIIVRVPNNEAKTWAVSNEVAMKFQQEIPNDNEKLFILIEKDFACLKTRENENEDESDLFANPNAHKGSCG